MVVFSLLALVISLGLDTLIVSITLGMLETKGRLKIAITFALAEAVMALVGLLVGQGIGHWIGRYASLIGGIALLAVAIWMLFFDNDDEALEKVDQRTLSGRLLLITALSISIDEIAVGFSIGVVGVPVVVTSLIIGMQALLFSLLGLFFGKKLKPYVGEWAEKAAGVVIGLLGIWILIHAL